MASIFKATTLGCDLQTVAQPCSHTRSDVAWTEVCYLHLGVGRRESFQNCCGQFGLVPLKLKTNPQKIDGWKKKSILFKMVPFQGMFLLIFEGVDSINFGV